MRDFRWVNLALLAKWRCHFLLEDGAIWRDIILALYGVCHPSPHLGGRPSGLRGCPRGGRAFSSSRVIGRLLRTGFLKGCLGLSGTVSRPSSHMIPGVG